MKAVWSWLSELAAFSRDVSAEEAAAALTRGGLEVEGIEGVGDGFSGVVVAEVVGVRRHPDADKLTLVDVIDRADGGKTEVVCGAPNVPDPGGRVLWARPGARLPGGLEIAARKIKGIESAGMLCSESELGLGEDHDGIIVLEPSEQNIALGTDAAGGLGLRDAVFDISTPANRSDALGHIGLARELVAALGGELHLPAVLPDELIDPTLETAALVAVDIADPTRCSRYTARIIDGVTVGVSPRWMRRRLALVGVRPLSNLVDVTNYVMFETGQPLHAFDYSHVRGQRISVRLATDGETMKTLDDIERALTGEDLLICDGEGPVAIAGVMGGLSSEVSDQTTRVLLEAAHFAPLSVRRSSKRLNLRSESSHRFERYVDPNSVPAASARAATLLAELGGGKIAADLLDVHPTVTVPVKLSMRASRATALTGVEIDVERAQTLLSSLSLPTEVTSGDKVTVTVPTWRSDLTREVDLIEEVLRLHGFDKVPATLPRLSAAPHARTDSRASVARDTLIGAGLSEAVTFGFTSEARIAALKLPEFDPRSRPIALRNPMSGDQAVMRTSLLPNLLDAVSHNLKRQISDVALFEIGSVFIGEVEGTTLPAEPLKVAAVMAGRRPGWLGDRGALDVFDLKGVLDELCRALLGSHHADTLIDAVATTEVPYLHPGIAGELTLEGGAIIGDFGEVHPTLREELEIEVPVFAFELSLHQFPVITAAQMTAIARYPSVTRDLSFFLGASIPVRVVEHEIRSMTEPLLESAELLEDYRDPAHVPEGQKGLLWSLTYRSHEKTLTDKETDAAHEAIVEHLLGTLRATRR